MAQVTMNLTEEELTLIEELRRHLRESTKTDTVGQSLRIANLVAQQLRNGKQLAVLDADGRPESKIVIPGISEK